VRTGARRTGADAGAATPPAVATPPSALSGAGAPSLAAAGILVHDARGGESPPAIQTIQTRGARAMSVAKIIEITAGSTKSFEDAVATGIERANTSLDEVQGAWIAEQKVKVAKGKVVEYRVTMKVTFLLKDKKK
jgi:flavin-binding protein dodecin